MTETTEHRIKLAQLRESRARELIADDEADAIRNLMTWTIAEAVTLEEQATRHLLERSDLLARERSLLLRVYQAVESEFCKRSEIEAEEIQLFAGILESAFTCVVWIATLQQLGVLEFEHLPRAAQAIAELESREFRALLVAATQDRSAAIERDVVVDRERQTEALRIEAERLVVCHRLQRELTLDTATEGLRMLRRTERLERVALMDAEATVWEQGIGCQRPSLQCLQDEELMRAILCGEEAAAATEIRSHARESVQAVRILERRRIVVQAHIAGRAHALFVEHNNFRTKLELVQLDEFVAIEEAFFDELQEVPRREAEGIRMRQDALEKFLRDMRDATVAQEGLRRDEIEGEAEDALLSLIDVFFDIQKQIEDRGHRRGSSHRGSVSHEIDITFYDNFYDAAARELRRTTRFAVELRERRAREDIAAEQRGSFSEKILAAKVAMLLEDVESAARAALLEEFAFHRPRDRAHRAIIEHHLSRLQSETWPSESAYASRATGGEDSNDAQQPTANASTSGDEEASPQLGGSGGEAGIAHLFSSMQRRFDELRHIDSIIVRNGGSPKLAARRSANHVPQPVPQHDCSDEAESPLLANSASPLLLQKPHSPQRANWAAPLSPTVRRVPEVPQSFRALPNPRSMRFMQAAVAAAAAD